MHLRALEIFCTVAEERSFSRAGSAHALTQSAVSQSVQHLEESLGVRLIDRSKRPLILTEAGRTYVRGLRPLLKGFRQLEEDVRSVGSRLRGRVVVAAVYSVGLSYMPEATAEFATLHPEVEVRTEYGSSQRVVELTSEGAVDFGLVSFPRSTRDLQYVIWQREPMRLVCSAEHPLASRTDVTVADLNGIRMIGFDRSLVIRHEIDQALAKVGVRVDVRMEFDNADSMVRAIQANRGIGIVPEAAVRRETATGTLRVVACRGFKMTRPLGILFRRSAELSRAASEFGSLLLGRPLEDEVRRRRKGSRKSSDEPPSIGVSGMSSRQRTAAG